MPNDQEELMHNKSSVEFQVIDLGRQKSKLEKLLSIPRGSYIRRSWSKTSVTWGEQHIRRNLHHATHWLLWRTNRPKC